MEFSNLQITILKQPVNVFVPHMPLQKIFLWAINKILYLMVGDYQVEVMVASLP